MMGRRRRRRCNGGGRLIPNGKFEGFNLEIVNRTGWKKKKTEETQRKIQQGGHMPAAHPERKTCSSK